MGSINLRIDDELKARSYAALEKMGVTPSEALRLMLEYIADNERLPFKQTLLSDEDAELVEMYGSTTYCNFYSHVKYSPLASSVRVIYVAFCCYTAPDIQPFFD